MIGSARAPATAAGHALLGNTGDHGAEVLTDGLQSLRFSGTLALTDAAGTMLLLLAKGQVEASYKLGGYDRLESTGQHFHLNPHSPSDLPQLPPRDPNSGSELLRALPRLTPPERLPPGAVDLPRLLERLNDEAFNGTVGYRTPRDSSLALLAGGTIRAAVHESGGALHSRAEALRALQKAGQTNARGVLELESLDAALALPLTALALERTAPDDKAAFTGLELTPAGYTYWRHGQPFLTVTGAVSGPQRRYALAEEGMVRTPEIELPSEPPGWEEQRYHLTLRGRDALNPMMELNMEFRNDHGSGGERVLTVLGGGATLEHCARELGFELGEMKPWLERLEGSGMIRSSKP